MLWFPFPLLRVVAVVLAVALAATPVLAEAADDDPLEGLNRGIHRFNRGLDRVLLRPIAVGYRAVTPGFVRRRISNFFSNVGDIETAANQFLQGKVTDGMSDVTRVVVNSTVGLGGLFDVATGSGLERHNEDLGQTLAVWGWHDSTYIELPVIGPSSIRDGLAFGASAWLNPLRLIDDIPTRNVAFGLRFVDLRYRLLGANALIEGDSYLFFKDTYEIRRDELISDGQGDAFLDEDF